MLAEDAGLQPLLDLSMYSSICRGEGAGSGGKADRQRGVCALTRKDILSFRALT